jgi:hypothetical protein
MCTIVVIVIVAVVSDTANLSTFGRSLLVNGAFLVIIILGFALYFGRKMKNMYYSQITERNSQMISGRSTRNIEKSFLNMVKIEYGHDTDDNEEEIIRELFPLISMLKKAHTPEAKLRVCNNQIIQWKSMLMLISDNLISTSTYVSTHDTPDTPDKEPELFILPKSSKERD